MNNADTLEYLAAIEHEQWIFWAKNIIETEPRITEDRIFRWEKLFIPYSELSEEMKEHDRVWARKVITFLELT